MMATEKRKHKPVLNKELLDNLNQVKLPDDKSDLLLKLDDQALNVVESSVNLNIISESYHKNFNNQKAVEWFNAHGIKKLNRLNELKINAGFSDGSLINMISESQSIELLKLNVLNDKEEQFLNCITIPVIDELGQVINIYGININDDKIKSLNEFNLFNQKACKVYDEVILTESIIDALSFIELDFNNVISVENADSFKQDYIKILKDNRVKTVILAFKKTVSAAFSEDKIKKMLLDENIEVKEITQISCDDWNKELFAGTTREDILNIINVAEIFKPEKSNDFAVKKDGLIYIFTVNDVTYRLSGVKDMFVSNLKVNVKAECKDDKYFDNLDLYSARSRNTYSQNLANIFNIESKRVEKDLIKILEYLEDERDKKLNAGSKGEKEEMTEDEKNLGLTFLKSPDLFQQIIDDMTSLGYVGEDLNKQLIYLCASSRILDDPISVMIISQSASGKSYLVDTVKKLIPPLDVISLTSLSDQALNYMEDMINKFMIFGEAMHNDKIDHQIRDMISAKELSRLTVTKDDKTGKIKTEHIRKDVIVSSVMTTTSHRINPENLSRFFVINTDESKEQTKKIHETQRLKYTIERINEKRELLPQIIKKHWCAQKLLRKIMIVNNFVKYLSFPDSLMRTRRDHDRFIDLIAVTCFLRQYQKEVKKEKNIEYIECDIEDYRIAYNIMINGILSSTILELPKGALEIYEAIRQMVKQTAEKNNLKVNEVGFSQRDLREFTGLSQTWIKQNLRLLVEYEYILILRGGNERKKGIYRLMEDEEIKKIDLKMIPSPEKIQKLQTGRSGQ